MELEVKIAMNRFGFAAPAFVALVLASGILSADAASNTGGNEATDACTIDHQVCYRSCKGLGKSCDDDCDRKNQACTIKRPATPKTGNHTPPTGGTKADPKKPQKVNDTRAPIGGGIKGEPKSPPKVNDTRAPIGGGTFHAKTTKAGSAPAPIQKPNSGNGPSVRSNNGRR